MRLSRVLLALLLTLSCLLWLGCGFIENRFPYSGDKIYSETIDLTGVDTVEIHLGSADLNVVSGDVTDAAFEIKKIYRSSKEEYIDELLARNKITFNRQGSRLIVKQEGEGGRAFDTLAHGYVRVRITATLPQVALRISTGSGDVRIDRRKAPISITTGTGDAVVDGAYSGIRWRSGSGDIKLKNAAGKITLNTGSGDMTVGEIRGKLDTSSGSGDVSIEHLEGDFNIAAGSGDVWIEESIGSAYIRTSSGDVGLDAHTGNADITATSGDLKIGTYPVAGEVALKSSSGNVDVVIYGSSVALDITTSSGTIAAKIPIVVKEASRRRLVGVGGDGLLKLTISTSSGDVDVKQGAV